MTTDHSRLWHSRSRGAHPDLLRMIPIPEFPRSACGDGIHDHRGILHRVHPRHLVVALGPARDRAFDALVQRSGREPEIAEVGLPFSFNSACNDLEHADAEGR